MTSAPRSASNLAAYRPATSCASSRTRIPASGKPDKLAYGSCRFLDKQCRATDHLSLADQLVDVFGLFKCERACDDWTDVATPHQLERVDDVLAGHVARADYFQLAAQQPLRVDRQL